MLVNITYNISTYNCQFQLLKLIKNVFVFNIHKENAPDYINTKQIKSIIKYLKINNNNKIGKRSPFYLSAFKKNVITASIMVTVR